MRLYSSVRTYDDYLKLKKDAIGRIRFSGLQCMAAMRMLAYGTTTDSRDEYIGMSKSTCIEAVVRFATKVVKVFGPEY